MQGRDGNAARALPTVASIPRAFSIIGRPFAHLTELPVPAPITPLHVGAYTATTAVGAGKATLVDAFERERSGLRPNDFSHRPLETWIGRVAGVESRPLPKALASWDCRNNRLAWMGLEADGFIDAAHAARERWGAARVALILGTSTSSIGATEEAYRVLDPDGQFPAALRNPLVHTPHSLANFVHHALALEGPCVTISTACSSSGKVFAAAERMLRLGLVDAAIVGGVDTLCGSVLFGFNSLQLVSPEACRPFDAERNGISIGEAAGFALLERGPGALELLGYGESSDAHHMSTPHPEGLGAERALDDALARAGIDAAAIDYLNLHGTASAKNDEVEAALVARRFDARTHASSTKGFVGHTLGAAGIVEAVACLLALEHGLLPGTVNTRTLDRVCGPQIRLRPARAEQLVRLRRQQLRAAVRARSFAVSGRTLFVDGVALWAPTLPGWNVARAAFRGEGALADPPARRPAPELLAPNERRRAPDTVSLALEVAAAAVRESGHAADALPAVFVSAHGDLAVNDSMCTTLVNEPTLISPTRFHNSVHNAAAGYWTIGTHCMQASTALTAYESTFAAGLVEAASQCAADAQAVLLAGFDIAAVGALRSVVASSGLLAVALVLAPARNARSVASLDWSLQSGASEPLVFASDAARSLAGNAMADALPLFEALASRSAAPLAMPLSARLALRVELGFFA